MHILLIHQYFLGDGAGGGSRWNEMARIWVEAGHSVTVIAGDVHYMQEKRQGMGVRRFDTSINQDAVRVIRCRVPDCYHNGFGGRFWGYLSFAWAAIYAGIRLARDNYQCIVATSPPLSVGIPGLVLAFWKRLPLVLEIRDLWPESALETGVLRNRCIIWLSYRFEEMLYRYARLVVPLTPAFSEMLIARKGVDTGKIRVIPNAADFRLSEKALAGADMTALRNTLGLTGKFVLVYVGAHGLANGLIQLVDAASLLTGTSAHFLLIGDGMEKKSLVAEVNMRMLKNVTFLDPVPKDEIFRYILLADAGLSVLKRADIFKTVYSNKTFDYFSCKRPVIMAIEGISQKLVEESGGGLFAEPENPSDFAAKIRIYLNDPEVARIHGEKGYRFARVHFDRERLSASFLEALEECTGQVSQGRVSAQKK